MTLCLLHFGELQAVVLYHVHEYAHALFLLVTLYQNIEPIDEVSSLSHLMYPCDLFFFGQWFVPLQRIALHVCLLLLDVALACRDASKAAVSFYGYIIYISFPGSMFVLCGSCNKTGVMHFWTRTQNSFCDFLV